MKIFLDDIRNPPDGFIVARNELEAIFLLKKYEVSEISFDHDLGNELENGTGYGVALYIESRAYDGSLPMMKWRIHSSNPVGRERIKAAMDSADRAWNARSCPNFRCTI